MSRRSLATGLILGLIIGLPTGYFLQQVFSDLYNQQHENELKIFCNAGESVQTNWYKSSPNEPVVSSMNETEVPELDIRVTVRNNNSISLFNIGIEVTYKTIDSNFSTITKTNLGFVDALSVKDIDITITNPYVSLWETKKAVYYDPDTHWTNGTVCVLNLDDISTIAYGYAEP